MLTFSLKYGKKKFMLVEEEFGDLFAVGDGFFFAHCISADAKMGAGIARRFVREFPALTSLREQTLSVGHTYQVGRVFNMVTKPRFFDKPTYKSLGQSMDSLVDLCDDMGVSRLAMPRIGCGLDRLQWPRVLPMITERFSRLPIEIAIRFI
jgi:hypothetical protein